MAYSTDNQDRVEQYFHIASILGRKGGIRGKPCIVIEFARYSYESGQVINKILTWHGPFESIRAAKVLIGSRRPSAATPAADPSEARKGATISA